MESTREYVGHYAKYRAQRIGQPIVAWYDTDYHKVRYVSLSDYENDPETQAFVSERDVIAIIDTDGNEL